METRWLPIQRIDMSSQTRAALQQSYVEMYEDYLDDATEEETWPFDTPCVVFYESKSRKYWLSSGAHRITAARRKEWKKVFCLIQEGTFRDAVIAGIADNSRAPRTTEDMTKSVKMVMENNPESLTVREIAHLAGVSKSFVQKIRKPSQSKPKPTTVNDKPKVPSPEDAVPFPEDDVLDDDDDGCRHQWDRNDTCRLCSEGLTVEDAWEAHNLQMRRWSHDLSQIKCEIEKWGQRPTVKAWFPVVGSCNYKFSQLQAILKQWLPVDFQDGQVVTKKQQQEAEK